MKKIGVIGNSESVKGFKALGLDVFEMDDEETVSKTIRSLAQSGYSIIYITERLFLLCSHEIEKYDEKKELAIIPIPGTYGNNGIGLKNVSKSVEKAVGSDILS